MQFTQKLIDDGLGFDEICNKLEEKINDSKVFYHRDL